MLDLTDFETTLTGTLEAVPGIPQSVEQLLETRSRDVHLPAPSARRDSICPAGVEAYAAGLRELSDKKLGLGHTLSLVNSDLDALLASIDAATAFQKTAVELFAGHPFRSDDLTETGVTYVKRYAELLREWLPGAQQKLADLEDDRARIEKCISDMNAVVVDATLPQAPTVKKACPVCFDTEVDTVLVPCGHTYCASCAGKSRKTCGMCRQPVKGTMKVFFSI